MPTKYVSDTFVGYVCPNDANDATDAKNAYNANDANNANNATDAKNVYDANNANDDGTSFFQTLIKELKEERKGIEETNCKERSLQEIFESLKEKLKDKLAIDKVDDFGAKPIYLFKGNGNDERYFLIHFTIRNRTIEK